MRDCETWVYSGSLVSLLSLSFPSVTCHARLCSVLSMFSMLAMDLEIQSGKGCERM